MNNSPQTLRGSISPACKDRPQTQVEVQVSEIQRELERGDKALAVHAEKLQPVLRQGAELAKNAECQPPEEMLVPSADALRTIQKRMTRQRLALENMTERTEA